MDEESKQKLEKLLFETEKYAEYNLQLKKTIEGYLHQADSSYSKLHYQTQISLLDGKAMGLYISAMTIRKMLGLEIPKDGNYQICFEDVFK